MSQNFRFTVACKKFKGHADQFLEKEELSISKLAESFNRFMSETKGISIVQNNENHLKKLFDNIFVYIICVSKFAESESILNWSSVKSFYAEISKAFDTRFWKDNFVKHLSIRIIQLMSDPAMQPWISKEILRMYLGVVVRTNREIRHTLMKNEGAFHLISMIDLLSCGDYEFQSMIVEFYCRMCTKEMLLQLKPNIYLGNEEQTEAFFNIKTKQFDRDTRKFLNLFNFKGNTVRSLLCCKILFNGYKMRSPEELQDFGGMWVDFNLKMRTITFFFDHEQFKDETDNGERWECAMILFDNISNSDVVYKMNEKRTAEVGVCKLTLKGPCDFLSKTTKLTACRNLTLYSYDLKTFKEIFNRRLPELKEKIKPKNKVPVVSRRNSHEYSQLDIITIKSGSSTATLNLSFGNSILGIRSGSRSSKNSRYLDSDRSDISIQKYLNASSASNRSDRSFTYDTPRVSLSRETTPPFETTSGNVAPTSSIVGEADSTSPATLKNNRLEHVDDEALKFNEQDDYITSFEKKQRAEKTRSKRVVVVHDDEQEQERTGFEEEKERVLSFSSFFKGNIFEGIRIAGGASKREAGSSLDDDTSRQVGDLYGQDDYLTLNENKQWGKESDVVAEEDRPTTSNALERVEKVSENDKSKPAEVASSSSRNAEKEGTKGKNVFVLAENVSTSKKTKNESQKTENGSVLVEKSKKTKKDSKKIENVARTTQNQSALVENVSSKSKKTKNVATARKTKNASKQVKNSVESNEKKHVMFGKRKNERESLSSEKENDLSSSQSPKRKTFEENFNTTKKKKKDVSPVFYSSGSARLDLLSQGRPVVSLLDMQRKNSALLFSDDYDDDHERARGGDTIESDFDRLRLMANFVDVEDKKAAGLEAFADEPSALETAEGKLTSTATEQFETANDDVYFPIDGGVAMPENPLSSIEEGKCNDVERRSNDDVGFSIAQKGDDGKKNESEDVVKMNARVKILGNVKLNPSYERSNTDDVWRRLDTQPIIMEDTNYDARRDRTTEEVRPDSSNVPEVIVVSEEETVSSGELARLRKEKRFLYEEEFSDENLSEIIDISEDSTEKSLEKRSESTKIKVVETTNKKFVKNKTNVDATSKAKGKKKLTNIEEKIDESNVDSCDSDIECNLKVLRERLMKDKLNKLTTKVAEKRVKREKSAPVLRDIKSKNKKEISPVILGRRLKEVKDDESPKETSKNEEIIHKKQTTMRQEKKKTLNTDNSQDYRENQQVSLNKNGRPQRKRKIVDYNEGEVEITRDNKEKMKVDEEMKKKKESVEDVEEKDKSELYEEVERSLQELFDQVMVEKPLDTTRTSSVETKRGRKLYDPDNPDETLMSTLVSETDGNETKQRSRSKLDQKKIKNKRNKEDMEDDKATSKKRKKTDKKQHDSDEIEWIEESTQRNDGEESIKSIKSENIQTDKIKSETRKKTDKKHDQQKKKVFVDEESIRPIKSKNIQNDVVKTETRKNTDQKHDLDEIETIEEFEQGKKSIQEEVFDSEESIKSIKSKNIQNDIVQSETRKMTDQKRDFDKIETINESEQRKKNKQKEVFDGEETTKSIKSKNTPNDVVKTGTRKKTDEKHDSDEIETIEESEQRKKNIQEEDLDGEESIKSITSKNIQNDVVRTETRKNTELNEIETIKESTHKKKNIEKEDFDLIGNIEESIKATKNKDNATERHDPLLLSQMSDPDTIGTIKKTTKRNNNKDTQDYFRKIERTKETDDDFDRIRTLNLESKSEEKTNDDLDQIKTFKEPSTRRNKDENRQRYNDFDRIETFEEYEARINEENGVNNKKQQHILTCDVNFDQIMIESNVRDEEVSKISDKEVEKKSTRKSSVDEGKRNVKVTNQKKKTYNLKRLSDKNGKKLSRSGPDVAKRATPKKRKVRNRFLEEKEEYEESMRRCDRKQKALKEMFDQMLESCRKNDGDAPRKKHNNGRKSSSEDDSKVSNRRGETIRKNGDDVKENDEDRSKKYKLNFPTTAEVRREGRREKRRAGGEREEATGLVMEDDDERFVSCRRRSDDVEGDGVGTKSVKDDGAVETDEVVRGLLKSFGKMAQLLNEDRFKPSSKTRKIFSKCVPWLEKL